MDFLRRLDDLRFVIGIFFSLLSVILFVAALLGHGTAEEGVKANLGVAISGAVFAIGMVMLSILRPIGPEHE